MLFTSNLKFLISAYSSVHSNQRKAALVASMFTTCFLFYCLHQLWLMPLPAVLLLLLPDIWLVSLPLHLPFAAYILSWFYVLVSFSRFLFITSCNATFLSKGNTSGCFRWIFIACIYAITVFPCDDIIYTWYLYLVAAFWYIYLTMIGWICTRIHKYIQWGRYIYIGMPYLFSPHIT